MRGSGAQRRIAHRRQPGLADALASAHNDREVPVRQSIHSTRAPEAKPPGCGSSAFIDLTP
jgi:hypothetical protein